MSFVNVSGDGAAQAFPEGASQADGEAIVQTWQKAAVLRVTPDIPVYWGFMAGEAHAQFLNQPAQTQGGQFAVRGAVMT